MASETLAAYVSVIVIPLNPFLQFTPWMNFPRVPALKAFIVDSAPQVK